MKYNYLKASKIYDKLYDLCCDPWTCVDEEKQADRRFFLNAITRGKKDIINHYIEYIKETKQCVCEPYPTDKSKVWDFDLMRQYDNLITEIENFSN